MKSKLIKFLVVAFISIWMALIITSCPPPPEKKKDGPPFQEPQTQMKDEADRQDRIPTPAERRPHP